VKIAYDVRSTFVYGGTLPAKTVDKAIRRVTGATATDWRAEQYLLAIDRWRDTLRRAILARIALTTAATPWIGGATSPLDVDELLLRDAARDAWRAHVQEFWAGQGLADAPAPSHNGAAEIWRAIDSGFSAAAGLIAHHTPATGQLAVTV